MHKELSGILTNPKLARECVLDFLHSRQVWHGVMIDGIVVAVLQDVITGDKHWIIGANLITDAGDLHYAQRAVSEALTNAFGIIEMGTAHTAVPAKAHNRSNITVAAGSQKAHDATYPKRNDSDPDNTGAGVDIVTFRTSYTTAENNNAGLTEYIITNVTPAASEPILTHADLTAFTKTSSDTLKMFGNHTFNGI